MVVLTLLKYRDCGLLSCAVVTLGWYCAHMYIDCLLSTQVPWDDLRYIFGEIMYGGHIVEDWDRRLANAYLFKYCNETLIEGMEMFPAFFTPANTMTHKQAILNAAAVMPQSVSRCNRHFAAYSCF